MGSSNTTDSRRSHRRRTNHFPFSARGHIAGSQAARSTRGSSSSKHTTMASLIRVTTRTSRSVGLQGAILASIHIHIRHSSLTCHRLYLIHIPSRLWHLRPSDPHGLLPSRGHPLHQQLQVLQQRSNDLQPPVLRTAGLRPLHSPLIHRGTNRPFCHHLRKRPTISNRSRNGGLIFDGGMKHFVKPCLPYERRSGRKRKRQRRSL